MGVEITLDTGIKRKPNLVAEKMGDEVVMMGVKSGKYYKLNTTSARIWELLEEEITPLKIVEILLSEYEIDEDLCRSEVLDILNQFAREQIVDVTE